MKFTRYVDNETVKNGLELSGDLPKLGMRFSANTQTLAYMVPPKSEVMITIRNKKTNDIMYHVTINNCLFNKKQLITMSKHHIKILVQSLKAGKIDRSKG